MQQGVSYSLFALVITFSILASCATAFGCGLFLGLLCGVTCIQKWRVKKRKEKVPASVNTTMVSPVYEEVEMKNETTTVDLLPNEAYGLTKKT